MAHEGGADGRFFDRLFGTWMAWLKGRSLGDEFEPLREVVWRHVFDNFSVWKGVLMLGVPSEGMASSNPQKSLSLKGFVKRNAKDLICRGLATRDAGGGIVPLNFVTQQMLDAYEREKKFFGPRRIRMRKLKLARMVPITSGRRDRAASPSVTSPAS